MYDFNADRFRNNLKIRLQLFSNEEFPTHCTADLNRCNEYIEKYFLVHTYGWGGYFKTFLAACCKNHETNHGENYEEITKEEAIMLYILHK